MESDKWPEIKIIDPIGALKKAAHFVLDQFTYCPDYSSDHYRGAAATLDEHLYGQEQA